MDTDAWAQLDEESAGHLRDRFDGAGLGHLLTVLLAAPTPQESQDVGAQGATEKAKSARYRDEEEAMSNAIRDSIASGAPNEDSRRRAIATAMERGADEAAAIALVDKRLRENAANVKWRRVQGSLKQRRQPILDLLSRTGKSVDCISVDLVCTITSELFVDPVTTSDGETYERGAIEHWFALGHTTSPSTNQELDPSDRLYPNVNCRQRITTFEEELKSIVAFVAGYSLADVMASWQPPENYETTCGSLAVLAKAFAQGATIVALKSNGNGTATVECDTSDDAQKLLTLGKFSPDGGPTTVVFSKLLASVRATTVKISGGEPRVFIGGVFEYTTEKAKKEAEAEKAKHALEEQIKKDAETAAMQQVQGPTVSDDGMCSI
jgi:hypothetical protein